MSGRDTLRRVTHYPFAQRKGYEFFVFNFELDGDADVHVVFDPLDTRFEGNAPEGRTAKNWYSKYAAIGLAIRSSVEESMMHGLTGANLNLPNFTERQAVSKAYDMNVVARWKVPTYVLIPFRNVA